MRAISVATKGWIRSIGIEVATRGIISGAIGVLRAEILSFVSKFTRSMRFTSKRTGVINGT